ncbi:MAG: VCBS repeat-containing protein [SAR324 cluster bacterium]|nr:VCBS repeat-containing protein [SAR324 cluster bacterium]
MNSSRYFSLLLIVSTLFLADCASDHRNETPSPEPSATTGTFFQTPYEISAGENPMFITSLGWKGGSHIDGIVVTSPLTQPTADLLTDRTISLHKTIPDIDSTTPVESLLETETVYPFSAPDSIILWRQHMVSGQFDNDTDGFQDFAVSDTSSSTVTLWNGVGDGAFIKSLTYVVESLPLFLATGDWNHDQFTDIAAVNYGSNTITILFNDGSGIFSNLPVAIVTTGVLPIRVIGDDWNGDSSLDLAVLSQDQKLLEIWKNPGNGRDFEKVVTMTLSGIPQDMKSGDWDGDGKSDLAITTQAAETLTLLYGNGDFSFRKLEIGAGNGPEQIVIADLNKDNFPDFIIGNSFIFTTVSLSRRTGDIALILSQHQGNQEMITTQEAFISRFIAATTAPMGSPPAFLHVNDINGMHSPICGFHYRSEKRWL